MKKDETKEWPSQKLGRQITDVLPLLLVVVLVTSVFIITLDV